MSQRQQVEQALKQAEYQGQVAAFQSIIEVRFPCF